MALLFLASIALLAPSAVVKADSASLSQDLSLGISLLLIATYGLGLYFTLGTHRKFFLSTASHETSQEPLAMPLALSVLAVTTVLVALVSEVFRRVGYRRG